MRLFEEEKNHTNAATLLASLFSEFKQTEVESLSQNISPSMLDCQVACALKLQGVQPEPELRSFQSGSFADSGTDRHARIQAFLSTTPYWVPVGDYLKLKNLPLEIVPPKPGSSKWETQLQHKTLPIRFQCDGILFIYDKYYILEIKTERNAANITRISPEGKHQKQGISYSYLLDIDAILWIYEGRDSFDKKIFQQEVQITDKENIKSYIELIVQNKNTPELLIPNKSACTYCSYKKHCRKLFKEAKK